MIKKLILVAFLLGTISFSLVADEETNTSSTYDEPSEVTEDSTAAFAEDAPPEYEMGDQIFTLTLGPHFHLGTGFPGGKPEPYSRNGWGGSGSIGWESFLARNHSIGVQLGYMFSKAKDGEFVNSIPLVARYNWYVVSGKFDLPLSAALGINVLSKGDQVFVGPIMKLGAGFIFDIDQHWELGVTLDYWLIPEFKLSENGHTAYWNSLDTGITLRYNL